VGFEAISVICGCVEVFCIASLHWLCCGCTGDVTKSIDVQRVGAALTLDFLIDVEYQVLNQIKLGCSVLVADALCGAMPCNDP
jgi:hypothetical protein